MLASFSSGQDESQLDLIRESPPIDSDYSVPALAVGAFVIVRQTGSARQRTLRITLGASVSLAGSLSYTQY